MSFAASWYRASCALLLLTLYFSVFSFYLPFLLSLSPPLSLSLSRSLSLSHPLPLSLSPSPSLSYKIHQPFTDYLLRLPSSELLEKHLFRSRANRRLVRSHTTLHHSRFHCFLFFCYVLLDHAPPFINSIASYSFVMYC